MKSSTGCLGVEGGGYVLNWVSNPTQGVRKGPKLWDGVALQHLMIFLLQ